MMQLELLHNYYKMLKAIKSERKQGWTLAILAFVRFL